VVERREGGEVREDKEIEKVWWWERIRNSNI
jgi:hypothetical protein